MRQLILASGSRYRQQQLANLGLRFESIAPAIDESPLKSESPRDCAIRLALYKARSVAARHPNAVVIGADQTGDLAGRLLHKPGNHDAAVTQLRAMAGNTVHFHSAIALVYDGYHGQDCVTTAVTLSPLTDNQIQHYLALDQPYDCAGSFKIESAGSLLMASVRSDDPAALIGLPLIALIRLLRDAGLDPLSSVP